MARSQTATWITQMARISTAPTRAAIAQPTPVAPLSENAGKRATASTAHTTATSAQPAPISVISRCGVIRAATAGCSVAPYAPIWSAEYLASRIATA